MTPKQELPPMTTIYPDCAACDGLGVTFVELPAHTMNSGFDLFEVDCPTCKGEGWIEVEVCESCRQEESDCKCVEAFEAELQKLMEATEHLDPVAV